MRARSLPNANRRAFARARSAGNADRSVGGPAGSELSLGRALGVTATRAEPRESRVRETYDSFRDVSSPPKRSSSIDGEEIEDRDLRVVIHFKTAGYC